MDAANAVSMAIIFLEELMDFNELNSSIPGPDSVAAEKAQARWNNIAKPVGSLGRLEDIIIRIAALTGDANVNIDKRAVLVLSADNGVLAQGVAQTPGEITAVMTGFISRGRSAVGCMANAAGADVITVDMGMFTRIEEDGLIDRRIADGTKDMSKEPAMSKEQAIQAIQTGIDLVRDCKEKGYGIIATGEMGIGNTTTSSAVASVLLGCPVDMMTGRGAGLSDEGLSKKKAAIERAIEVNKPDAGDALDVLSKLGGFDIAGLCGVFIGGALYRIPVIIDGIISSVSALCALRLCPAVKYALIPSHKSAEPASVAVLDSLGQQALIDANMRLGEGTGAVAAMPLLDMALKVYKDLMTFEDIGM